MSKYDPGTLSPTNTCQDFNPDDPRHNWRLVPGMAGLERCMSCGLEKNRPEGTSSVVHPSHYGGKDNPYEAIKVIVAWDLNFNLGNVVKYIARQGKKRRGSRLEDLKKAREYLTFEIEALERQS